MNRLVLASGTVLAFAFAVAMQGCSSSDSGTGGSGNATSGGTGNSATGGTVATTGGTTTTTTGGTGAGGTSSMTTGGTAAGGAAAGGTAAGGAAAGGTAAGGTAAGGTAAGGGGSVATMLCAAGETKNMPCTTATPEGMACNKTCGITAAGSVKAETCTGNLYVEGACTYPAGGSYTCYKKPAAPATCDGAMSYTDTKIMMTADVVTSGAACTVADCAPCGPYKDGTGNLKVGGLCVCKMGTGGTSKWTCASATEWPPQTP